VQIDIVAKTHGAAVALRDLVITALQSTDPPATRQPGGFTDYDEVTKTYRITMDYQFSASSAAGSP